MAIPWIPRIYVVGNLFAKPQTITIAARLGIPITQVVGCLLRFWLEAQVKADVDGRIQRKGAAWLDSLVGVTGFADATVAAGWLIVTPTALEVVNFDEWISKKATKRIENAVRQADKRAVERNGGSDHECDIRTLPHTSAHKVPVAADKPKKTRAKQAVVTDVRFWKFWQAYPKQWNQPAAYEEWVKLNPDDGLVETILAAIETWKNHPQWRKDNGQFIPTPVNWLAGRRWQDTADSGGGVQGSGRVKSEAGNYGRKPSYKPAAGPPDQPKPATGLFD